MSSMSITVPKEKGFEYQQMLKMVSPPNLKSTKPKNQDVAVRKDSLASLNSDINSSSERELVLELSQKKSKKKNDDTLNSNGYSSLIRRDFFNREGPKRQPMALV